jgi:hypothetical protein
VNDARYRLVSPPEPIVWRPGFGPRYTVFVDVEEQFDWTAPFERTRHSTSAMAAFPEAHARFREQGVALTCLVDYPIVDDPAAVEILRDVVADRRSEIGAQLHPWVNPPFGEPLTPAMSFAGEAPLSHECDRHGVRSTPARVSRRSLRGWPGHVRDTHGARLSPR